MAYRTGYAALLVLSLMFLGEAFGELSTVQAWPESLRKDTCTLNSLYRQKRIVVMLNAQQLRPFSLTAAFMHQDRPVSTSNLVVIQTKG
jgi:hypothetical protein